MEWALIAVLVLFPSRIGWSKWGLAFGAPWWWSLGAAVVPPLVGKLFEKRTLCPPSTFPTNGKTHPDPSVFDPATLNDQQLAAAKQSICDNLDHWEAAEKQGNRMAKHHIHTLMNDLVEANAEIKRRNGEQALPERTVVTPPADVVDANDAGR